MAETIFAQLLLLPQPPCNPLYNTLVIMNLCKALPGAFPAVVAGAVRALFAVCLHEPQLKTSISGTVSITLWDYQVLEQSHLGARVTVPELDSPMVTTFGMSEIGPWWLIDSSAQSGDVIMRMIARNSISEKLAEDIDGA
ncbi:Nuclear cap-binding protein subunit 1 [Linum perenne]